MIRSTLVAILAISIAFMTGCADVALNSSSQTMLNTMAKHRQNTTPQQTQTAYFLLGLEYQSEPIETGKKIIEQYQQLSTQYHGDDDTRSQKLHEFRAQFAKLEKPESDGLFCNWRNNQSCIDEIFKQQHEWQNNRQKYHALEQRYLQFLNMPPAVTPFVMEAISPIPSYQHLTQGQKLAILQLFQQAKNGQKALAREQSLQQLAQLRLHLAQSDTLIDKMVLNNLINNQLQAIALLKTRYQVDFQQDITPLTEQERNFTLAFYQEFAMQTELFKNLLNEYYILLYKPNDTINKTADFWIKIVEIQQLDIKKFNEFYQQENNKESEYAVKINRFYNYIGHTLANIAPPDYKVYMARLYHTQNMINITNYILTDGKIPLNNLFQKQIQHSENSICMDFIDEQSDNVWKCIYK
ncbi:hypothetical protein [Moraxella sp. ZY210820]|uniref:hypothetical protein n=1 Tax=unclassified Moraxella TaxID=2685852 RepID=UPI002730322E|nr:hypothetical protein [Moraxella sp. ZY210820]WLF83841.1 hypothetical protein LU301_11445 [Moraxella sp. ZY210820]